MSSYRSKLHEAPFVGPPWWVAGGWLALALLAQVTLLHYVAIRNVEPSLVIVAVVWYAVRVDVRRAALYGLIAGLCEDALAPGSGAAWTISTTLVAIPASALSRGFFSDSIPIVSFVAAAATLLRNGVFWIVMALQGYPRGLGRMHLHESLFQALLDAAAMAVVMLLV
ncbi:MAG: rod shape-determining protein MreD, partial [Vulcanimicrobiaceae bacterium]